MTLRRHLLYQRGARFKPSAGGGASQGARYGVSSFGTQARGPSWTPMRVGRFARPGAESLASACGAFLLPIEKGLAMDRQMMVDRLRLAEQHVKDGEAIVERQRVLVALLTAHGHPTSMAKVLLAQFTHTL